MKLKKILAAAAAATLAFSAVSALTASAAITNANSDDGATYVYNVLDNLPAGCSISDVYGASFVFSGYDAESGTGGGFVWNSNSQSWNQAEWGNVDANKPLSFSDDDLTVTRLEATPIFSESDEYCQVVIAQWDSWGVDMTVESVTLLGADGQALGGGATVTTTTAAQGGGTVTTTTQAAGSTDTGVNGIVGLAGIICLVALAGGAAVVCKKHD